MDPDAATLLHMHGSQSSSTSTSTTSSSPPILLQRPHHQLPLPVQHFTPHTYGLLSTYPQQQRNHSSATNPPYSTTALRPPPSQQQQQQQSSSPQRANPSGTTSSSSSFSSSPRSSSFSAPSSTFPLSGSFMMNSAAAPFGFHPNQPQHPMLLQRRPSLVKPESPDSNQASPTSMAVHSSSPRGGKPFVLSRSESFTFVKEWLSEAFEERKESAVSTRGVYDDYKAFCEKKAIEVMCPSAFGKLFKKVFPHITVRRLGPRGENFNHYYNLGRKSSLSSATAAEESKVNLPAFPPMLPPSRETSASAALRGAAAMVGLPPLLPPPTGSPYHLPSPLSHLGQATMPLGAYAAGLTLPPPMPGIGLPAPHHPSSAHQLTYYHQQPSAMYHNPQQLLHAPSVSSFVPASMGKTPLHGAWNNDIRHDVLGRLPEYREWYLNECWPFQPINPEALELEVLQHFSVTDGPLIGRETLALSSFLAMSIAAFNLGDFEISREFFNRARSQLGYLFDETSIDIAFVLQPLSLVSHWWTGKDSSAYYHTLLSEMCGQLNALNSDLFISSLQTHYLIKTYDIAEWRKKLEALSKFPRYPSIPPHWNCTDSLAARLRTQGGTWHHVITQLLEILELLDAYRKHDLALSETNEASNSSARKRKREHGRNESEGSRAEADTADNSASSDGDEPRDESSAALTAEDLRDKRKKLDSIGQRLSVLNSHMDRIIQERDWSTMPRVSTTLLKGWIMMVDIEYKAFLDFEDDLERQETESPAKLVRVGHEKNNDTLGSRAAGLEVSTQEAHLRGGDHRHRLGHRERSGKAKGNRPERFLQSERASEEMLEFFSKLEVPTRGVTMSLLHNFFRGPLIDIFHQSHNTTALRRLLELISPLSVVMSLGDIRHRLVELLR